MSDKIIHRSSTPKITASKRDKFFFNLPVTPILPSGSNESYDETTIASMKEEERDVVEDSQEEEDGKENINGNVSRERSLVGTPVVKNKLKMPELYTPQTKKDREQRIQRKHSALSDVSSADEMAHLPSSMQQRLKSTSDRHSPMDTSYRKPSAPYGSHSDEDVKETVNDSLMEEDKFATAPLASHEDDSDENVVKKSKAKKDYSEVVIDSDESEKSVFLEDESEGAPIVIDSDKSDSSASLNSKDDIMESEEEVEETHNSFIATEAEDTKITRYQSSSGSSIDDSTPSSRQSYASDIDDESIVIDESIVEELPPRRQKQAAAIPSISSGSGSRGSGSHHDDPINIADSSDEERRPPVRGKKIKNAFAAGDSIINIDESADERPHVKGKWNQQAGSRTKMGGNNKDDPISIDSSSEEEETPVILTAADKESVKNMTREQVFATLESLKKINRENTNDNGEKIRHRIALLQDRLKAPFDVEAIEGKAKPEQIDLDPYLNNEKRLYGGKMTEKRQEKIAALTDEVIQEIHGSLNAMPENVVTDTPADLSVDLMLHQKHGLTWMKWREAQRLPRGGILADDMGLGKTLSVISLIVSQKNDRKNSPEIKETLAKEMNRQFSHERDIIPAYSTLVIAPASVIYQWKKEIEDRVKPGKLKVYVFHGQNRERDPVKLARNDVVITTYAIISSELGEDKPLIGHETDDEDGDEWYSKAKSGKKAISKRNKKSVLTQIGWERIVLDEAHNIKNRNSLTSKGCCALHALKRWCLTGTPIHNELLDFYSLVRFLRLSPFSDYGYWKQNMDLKQKVPIERLNTIVKNILLRRTKNQLCPVTNMPLVNLKPRTFEIVEIELEGVEQKCYQQMMQASQQKVKDLLNQQSDQFQRHRRNKGTNVIKNPFVNGNRQIDLDDNFKMMSCLLVLLLRLRQASVHMALTKQAVDIDAFKDDGGEGADDVMDELEKTFGNISLGAEQMVAQENNQIDKIFETSYPSAKLKVLLEKVDHVIESGDKCVIISQWTSMLDIVEQHLKKKKLKLTAINGSIVTKDRQERIDSFNRKNGGAQVMLLSLTAGGVGLNLVGGNHLFLLDLHWNPALEQQAMDRIYRMGQSKAVFIHKLVCKDTVEQRVLELQKTKTELAASVLEGAAKKSKKLNINEIKYLFGMIKETPSTKPQEPYQPNNVRTRE